MTRLGVGDLHPIPKRWDPPGDLHHRAGLAQVSERLKRLGPQREVVRARVAAVLQQLVARVAAAQGALVLCGWGGGEADGGGGLGGRVGQRSWRWGRSGALQQRV